MKKEHRKYLIITLILFLTLSSSIMLFSKVNTEKNIIKDTYRISEDYVSLGYQTDQLLEYAWEYDYNQWDKEIKKLIDAWKTLEKDATNLELEATKLTKSKTVNLNFFTPTYAYDKDEITRIFDKAPVGQKIKTLANHLGVDAKRA